MVVTSSNSVERISYPPFLDGIFVVLKTRMAEK